MAQKANTIAPKPKVTENRVVEAVVAQSKIPDVALEKPIPASDLPVSKLKRSSKPVAKQHIPSLFPDLFSIKDSLEDKGDTLAEMPQQELKRPSKHFSQTDLDSEWQKFLAQLKQKDSFKHMLIQNVILNKQTETLVEVSVASDAVKEEFLHIKTEFFNHFAHKVNNHCIEINFKFNESLMVEKPNKRKLFDKFAELNPTLADLDKLLKLDFS